ncbi:hypothetical protein OAO05_01170 [bacterium]|nr:hypothetical protein [bacterium]
MLKTSPKIFAEILIKNLINLIIGIETIRIGINDNGYVIKTTSLSKPLNIKASLIPVNKIENIMAKKIRKKLLLAFKNFNMGLIISGLTGDHNKITATKEIAVFYDLELLYNVKRFTAPGNRTPL